MNIIIEGIKNNLFIVIISLLMLVGGTLMAYRKFGIKRVLLGKRYDHRELVYKNEDNTIQWKETLRTWKIILTGGMSLLSIFLLIMLLSLAFIYSHDIKATRDNDELLCKTFGTINPNQDQLDEYYGVVKTKNISYSGNYGGIKTPESN